MFEELQRLILRHPFGNSRLGYRECTPERDRSVIKCYISLGNYLV